MANSPFELNYGHPGQSLYDLENNAWFFERSPIQGGRVQQLGSFKLAISPAIHEEAIAANVGWKSNAEVRQTVTELGRDIPEIAPATNLLPDLAQVSAAISHATDTYDPAVGQLLSFGTFTGGGSYMYPRRIAAISTGETGNILCLLALTKERQGWDADKGLWIEGPSLANCECGYWAGDAAPIQQVCFSQADNRSSFLAVRYPTKTVLFRPWQNFKPSTRSQFYRFPPSRIDARQILTLSAEETGGAQHADATFNNEYQRQFGVIDQKGFWSVWDIDSGYRESDYKMSCTVTGAISYAEPEETEVSGPSTREDGWARILWIGNVNTILVCNRRKLKAFDIRGGQPTPLPCAEPIAGHSADWILDIRKHPQHKDQVFVLTSTRLLLIAVTCPNDVPQYGGNEPGAHILMSRVHYRGVDDITLQAYVCTNIDEETAVFVHSRLNQLISVFRYQRNEQSMLAPYLSPAPVQLELNPDLFQSDSGPLSVTSFHLDDLKFLEGENLHGEGPGSQYLALGIRFSRLTVMLSNLSVYQSLLVSYPQAPKLDLASLAVDPPNWFKVNRPHLGVDRSTLLVDPDDFVVPDGLASTSKPQFVGFALQEQSRLWKPEGGPSTEQQHNVNRKVDHQLAYQALNNQTSILADDALSMGFRNITDLVQEVEDILGEELDQEEVPRETMFELASGFNIRVSDIDQASEQVQALFNDVRPQGSSQLQHIASDRSLYTADAEDEMSSISALYDTILERWIGSLPEHIPVSVRQVKERLARRIATEVTLAGGRIRKQTGDALTQRAVNDESAGLPILSSQNDLPQSVLPIHSFSQPQPQAPAFSQSAIIPPISASQPLPSRTATADAISLHTIPSTPAARLSQHLFFGKPGPETSSSIRDVLTHWTPGADPKAYQWDGKILGYGEDEDEEDEESQRLLRQKKKSEEQLRKKQRRELEKEKRMVESQPIIGLERGGIRSSPAPLLGFGMSSQVMPYMNSQMGIVQSQTAPGKHGGRPSTSKKKVKDKRKSGF